VTPSTPSADRKSLRDFGLVTGAITAVLFGAVLPWARSRSYPLWPWVVGAVLVLWALTAPTTLAGPHRLWMKLGHVLGWTNTRIVLGVAFYGLVVPLGLIMRRFRPDPLLRDFDETAASYRRPTAVRPNTHLERPF
jgi:hypothetical protein